MANLLKHDDEPATILIGVREESDGTGAIVGFSHESWMTDANIQQKVAAQLNRTPNITWSVLTLSGVTVGVLQILPGGRPFYALRDSGALKRHHAVIRVGSSTDIASPDQICSWMDHDRELAVRRLEVERLESEQAIRGRLSPGGYSNSGGTCSRKFELCNDGVAPFIPVNVVCSWSIDEDAVFGWLAQRQVRLLKPVPPAFDPRLITKEAVRPGAPIAWEVSYDQVAVMDLAEQCIQGRTEGTVPNMNEFRAFMLATACCSVDITCENVAGTRTKVISQRFGWDPGRVFR